MLPFYGLNANVRILDKVHTICGLNKNESYMMLFFYI